MWSAAAAIDFKSGVVSIRRLIYGVAKVLFFSRTQTRKIALNKNTRPLICIERILSIKNSRYPASHLDVRRFSPSAELFLFCLGE